MKKITGIILGILVAASTAFATNGNGEKAKYEVDANTSKVYWTGGKVTGSSHTGYLLVGNGSMIIEDNKIVGGEITMDMNSIVCTDIEKESSNQRLIGHFKSDDFFSVEKYPNASFVISSVKAGEISGNLSIKGITHEIKFPVKTSIKNGTVTAIGAMNIDRTKWDVKYGSGKFYDGLGDKMIKDEFEIKFELTSRAESNLSSK